MAKKAAKKASKKSAKKSAKKSTKKVAKKSAKKAAKKSVKKGRRTVQRSRAGNKLYAKRDRTGKFKDIQTYKRAHGQDVKRQAKDED